MTTSSSSIQVKVSKDYSKDVKGTHKAKVDRESKVVMELSKKINDNEAKETVRVGTVG